MEGVAPSAEQEIAAVLDLETKRSEIATLLENEELLTAETQEALRSGIAKIGGQILEIVGHSGFQDNLITYSRTAAKNLAGLTKIKGIVPDEELEPKRSDFISQLAAMRAFIERYGSELSDEAMSSLQQSLGEVATIGGLEPVITLITAEELGSPEGTKSTLKITVRHGIVKIGKKGKSYKLDPVHPQSQYDYSQARLAALKALAEGGSLSVQELKDIIGDPEMDNNYFAWIRNWLLNLRHGQNSLIEQPKRGVYEFSDKYQPEIVEITTPTVEKRQTPEFVGRGSDLYIVAHHANRFNQINQQLFGFEITQELINDLTQYQPDHSDIRGDREAILRSRKEAFDRLFDDHADLWKFLSIISENSPAYDFADKLLSLNDSQKNMLGRFMHSTVEVSEIDENSNWVTVTDALGSRGDNEVIVLRVDKTNMTPPLDLETNGAPENKPGSQNEYTEIEAVLPRLRVMARKGHNADSIIEALSLNPVDRQRVIAHVAAARRDA